MTLPPIAILAGGLATRLRPLTDAVPKSLVDVAGKPFLAHQLELLRRNGLERVVLCVGHLGDQIERVIGDGRAFDLAITYVADGPALLGTAGALVGALPHLGERFYVLYGDSYLDVDYPAIAHAHAESGKVGLMTVYRNAGRFDRSNVLYRDNRIVCYDKHRPTPAMAHIDYGLSVLRADALADLTPGTRADLADVFAALVARGEMAGYEVDRRFYEIGSIDGLRETRAFLDQKDST